MHDSLHNASKLKRTSKGKTSLAVLGIFLNGSNYFSNIFALTKKIIICQAFPLLNF